jgi:dTDP-4-amino-4,6-dideoxygalactose transaminase
VSTSIDPQTIPDYARFAIGFDDRDRARLHALIDEVLDSNRWTEASMNARFEDAWALWNEIPAVALGSWSGGALSALHFAGVGNGDTVLCPSNTFMATPLTAIRAGAEVQFVDCNRDDLCMSFADFERWAERYRPKAAFLVHIGGHIAFESEQIAAYCADRGIFLIEDCAHAHGASWNGRKAGGYGDAGVYSMYATKTVSTGEGGVLVSKRPELLEHARAFRNYGKPSYEVKGLNFRMNEFTAALGLIQIERLGEVVAWKNEVARADLDPRFAGSRLELPEGMVSGLYKYVVFEWLERSTGRVYDEPCHRILGHHVELPNSDWVTRNHSCPPLYYRPLGSEEGDR